MTCYKVVFLRHGESLWNKTNQFSGWYDADLSELGVEEAHSAAELLKENGYKFDVAYTSLLTRAIKTLYYIQDGLNLHWIPVHRHWRLNERMYGGLTGLNKAETAAQYGDAQVKIWRRSYDTPPPPVELSSEHYPGSDPRYAMLDKSLIPRSECLKDTVNRALPYWFDNIVPSIKRGERVIVVAHGNSIRALMKHLDNIGDAEIAELNIPTGIPLVYELDGDLKPIKHYYLADEAQVKAAQEKVANQGKAK